MKKYAKRLAALALSALMVLALAACGGGSAGGKTTGIYLTPGRLSYQNMRPQYNYYLTTFDQQELTLMDDETYCLVISSSCFSALELAESTNDAKGNERTNYIVKFYGTYTSQVNDLDEDLLDVTLSAPTRVVRSQDQTYWLDTDNWNDDMGKAVVPGTIDTTTGAALDRRAVPGERGLSRDHHSGEHQDRLLRLHSRLYGRVSPAASRAAEG